MAQQKITPFLWFDDQAEEAAKFYTSIFPNSKIGKIEYFTEAGPRPAGMVVTVSFQIEGQEFVALNGEPEFSFTPAISFLVECNSQEEVDLYWEKLTEGGKEVECGWLEDKYGVSWQIVPAILTELMQNNDPEKARRVTEALLKMKKIDIETLKRAYEGEEVVSAA